MSIPLEVWDLIFEYCSNEVLYQLRFFDDYWDLAKRILLKRISSIPWEISADYTYDTYNFLIHNTSIHIGWVNRSRKDIVDELAILEGVGGEIVVNCLFGDVMPNVLVKCVGEIDLDVSYGDTWKSFYIVNPTQPTIGSLNPRTCQKILPLESKQHKNGHKISFYRSLNAFY